MTESKLFFPIITTKYKELLFTHCALSAFTTQFKQSSLEWILAGRYEHISSDSISSAH